MNEINQTIGHRILEQILTEFGEQRIPSWDAVALINGAIAAEREACARIVEEHEEGFRHRGLGAGFFLSPRTEGNKTGLTFAAAIRARGEGNERTPFPL